MKSAKIALTELKIRVETRRNCAVADMFETKDLRVYNSFKGETEAYETVLTLIDDALERLEKY